MGVPDRGRRRSGYADTRSAAVTRVSWVTGTQTQRATPRPLLGPTASLSRLLHGQTTGSSRRWSAASLTAGALHAGGGVTWAQRAPRGVVAVGELSYGVARHRCRYPGRDGTDLLDRHLGSSGRRHGLSGQPGWWSVTRRSSHLPATPMCLRDYSACGRDPDVSAGEFGEDVEGSAAVLG